MAKAKVSPAATTAAPAGLYTLAENLKVRVGILTTQRNMEVAKVVWRTTDGGKVQRGTNRGRVLEALQGLGDSFTLAQAQAALAALQTADPNALGAGGKPAGWVSSWVRKQNIVQA